MRRPPARRRVGAFSYGPPIRCPVQQEEPDVTHPTHRSASDHHAGAMITLRIMHLAFMAGVGLFASSSCSSSSPPDRWPRRPRRRISRPAGRTLNCSLDHARRVRPLGAARDGVYPAGVPRHRAAAAARGQMTTRTPSNLGRGSAYTTRVLRAAMVEGWGSSVRWCAADRQHVVLLVPRGRRRLIGMYFPPSPDSNASTPTRSIGRHGRPSDEPYHRAPGHR